MDVDNFLKILFLLCFRWSFAPAEVLCEDHKGSERHCK